MIITNPILITPRVIKMGDGECMTKIIIKKRKTLLLNKKTPETEKNQPKLTGKQRGEEHNKKHQEEAQRQYIACKDWVYCSWPCLFDKDEVKPLAIGILEQIKAEYDKQGGFDLLGFYRNTPFKKVLSGWVKRKAYQKALIEEGALRYSLNGDPVETVSEMDKHTAMKRLEKAKKPAYKK